MGRRKTTDHKDTLAHISWFWRDWRASCARATMTPLARGIYREILDAHYMADDCTVPESESALIQLANCSPAEWRKVRDVVLPYLPVVSPGRRQNVRTKMEWDEGQRLRDAKRRGATHTNTGRWSGSHSDTLSDSHSDTLSGSHSGSHPPGGSVSPPSPSPSPSPSPVEDPPPPPQGGATASPRSGGRKRDALAIVASGGSIAACDQDGCRDIAEPGGVLCPYHAAKVRGTHTISVSTAPSQRLTARGPAPRLVGGDARG
jgi:uncharacterized protein YdaU (DUF1376 family)